MFDRLANGLRFASLAFCAVVVSTCGGGPSTGMATEPTYRAGLESANATQAARNASLMRGTVSDPDPANLARIAAQVAVDLEGYRASLSALKPPRSLAYAHEKMIDATADLIDNYRAIVEQFRGSQLDESSIPLLKENSAALLAFNRACRTLNGPAFVCGALLENGVTLTPTSEFR